MVDQKGFTGSDMMLLTETHQSGMAERGWGKAQFVTNDFSQYMAIWNNPALTDRPPGISIVRFVKTGTYALVVGGRIVASDKRLEKILPAVAAVTNRAYPSEQTDRQQLH